MFFSQDFFVGYKIYSALPAEITRGCIGISTKLFTFLNIGPSFSIIKRFHQFSLGLIFRIDFPCQCLGGGGVVFGRGFDISVVIPQVFKTTEVQPGSSWSTRVELVCGALDRYFKTPVLAPPGFPSGKTKEVPS